MKNYLETKEKMQKNNKQKGITLIALVITIIVLIILAGVSINLLLGENGLFIKAQNAAKDMDIASLKEQIGTELLSMQIENEGNNFAVEESDVEKILSKYGQIIRSEDGNIIALKPTGKEYEIPFKELWQGETTNSYNETKHVNKPKIAGTGLTPVIISEDGKITTTDENNANWYNYEEKKWANAQSADGSLWVWIPRYAYKITYQDNEDHSQGGSIDIKFLIGTTDNYEETNTETSSKTAKRVTANTTTDYYVHPAFTDESGIGYANGGWDRELTGIWIAKYAAGYQNATVGEDIKTVQYSDLKYTTITTVDSSYTSNFLTAELTTNTNLSYPVFKANTYAYNIISAGDAWLLSKEIDGKDQENGNRNIATASSFYGLSNVDSHMVKNSEWGAVVYLTYSQYGINGNATNMNGVVANNKNLNNEIYVNNATSGTKANVYAVTSYGSSDTPNDINASSTKNMTGIFDLNGCVLERVAGYYRGGSASTLNWHNAMASSSTTASTKYLTLYTDNNKKGDATNETAGWNADESKFVSSDYPVFHRGDTFTSKKNSNMFRYSYTNGSPNIGNGFRVCLAF